MLTDDLTHRLHDAAQTQPFVPDVSSAWVTARRLRRRRRVAAAGSAIVISAVAAILAVAAVAAVPRPADRPITVTDSPAEQQAVLPVTLTTRYDKANDVTCLVLTFTQTGDNVDAGCNRLDPSRDAALSGIVGGGGFARERVTAGGPPTTIAIGEVAGGGNVVITDDAGRRIRAAIVAPPAGYPFAMYYADLGSGSRWPKQLTYTAPNGKRQVLRLATPAPTAMR